MFALSARLQSTPTRATALVARAKVFGFPAFGFLLGMLVLSVSLGCEKGSPIASEGMVLTLRASPSAIFSHGDSTSITITATEADGRPAIDGLRIQLTATSGSLPAEVRTVNGSATAVFISDSQPGDVTITARAGAIGADGSVSATIVVQDRNIPIGAAVLTVNPSNLNITGGVVQARVVLTDEGGNPIPNRTVVFSSDLGQFSRNGAPLTTDAQGQALDSLTLGPIPSGIDSVAVEAQAGDRQLMKTVSISSNANPIPVIEFSPQQPRRDEQVFFSATRSSDADGPIRAYRWQFGDGTTGEGAQVSHTYPKAGSYAVILQVEDGVGTTASTTSVVTIGSNQPPAAVFRFSPSTPRVFETITFNASDSVDSDGQIASVVWDMGNGTTKEGPVISHAYASAGTYTVTLTVRDNDGAFHSTTQDVVVTGNIAPFADFTFSPTRPRIDETITFDAATSSDADGSIASYQWQFGDGQTGNGTLVQHAFSQAGTYVVRLTVRDNDGSTDVFTQEVIVTDNLSPVAAFTVSPSAPRVGQAVTFSAAGSSDPDGSIKQYSWAFGDGGFGTGLLVTHTYALEGNYQVTLTVIDNDNKQASTGQALAVSRGSAPQARLSVQPNTLPTPGGQVVLDASQTQDSESNLDDLSFKFSVAAPQGTVVEIASGTSPLRFANIFNLQAGQQVIFTVTATDPDGNSGTASAVLQAEQAGSNAAPNAQLTLTPATLEAPGGTLILDASATTDSDHSLSSLNFDYAYQTSGNVTVELTGANGPLNTARISNGQPGAAVTFLLTVTDPAGGQDAISKTLILSGGSVNTPPTVAFTSVPATSVSLANFGTQPLSITLDGRGTVDAETPLEGLSFLFSGASSNRDARVEIETLAQDPGLAIAKVFGALEGDQLLFTLKVTDPQGLSSLESIILQVVP